MIARLSLVLIGMATTLTAGCATKHDKYAWGTYDQTLYVY
jgi:hypothetical protein